VRAAASLWSPVAAGRSPEGIDELLACFIPRPRSRLKADRAQTLAVVASDVDDRWLLHIGPDGPQTEPQADTAADCTITGRAEDLYLLLWSRTDANRAAVRVEGDDTVFALFGDVVHIRWS